jgi:hypothetical protein
LKQQKQQQNSLARDRSFFRYKRCFMPLTDGERIATRDIYSLSTAAAAAAAAKLVLKAMIHLNPLNLPPLNPLNLPTVEQW